MVEHDVQSGNGLGTDLRKKAGWFGLPRFAGTERGLSTGMVCIARLGYFEEAWGWTICQFARRRSFKPSGSVEA
jgi:hypothetical protein